MSGVITGLCCAVTGVPKRVGRRATTSKPACIKPAKTSTRCVTRRSFNISNPPGSSNRKIRVVWLTREQPTFSTQLETSKLGEQRQLYSAELMLSSEFGRRWWCHTLRDCPGEEKTIHEI